MLRIQDIMTTDLITVPPEMTVREAMELFAMRHISGAPVVAESTLMGVVSSSDLLAFASALPGVPTEQDTSPLMDEVDPPPEWIEGEEPPATYFSEMWVDAGADVSERFDTIDTPEWNTLEEHTVDELMSQTLCALAPDVGVEEAAAYMRRRGVHRLLVLDGEELVGMVTTTDIANAVADHMLTK